MALKRCPRCEEEKDLETEFYGRRTRSGWATYCKACDRIRKQAWRDANPEKVRKTSLEATRRHREKIGVHVEPGFCAICETYGKLVVDHNHVCCPGVKPCGRCRRDTICIPCNVALGMIQDDPKRAYALAAYLICHPLGGVS